MSWMDEAMKDLRPWIGRVRTVEDDVGLMAVRRAAGAFNVDPGEVLARHRAAAALVHLLRRRDGAPERHRARRPRQEGHRAAADPDAAPHGRRPPRQGHGPPARRRARGEEGRGRRHRPQERPLGRHLRADHAPHLSSRPARRIAVDEMDAIYRPAVPAGQKTTATVPTQARTDHAWSETHRAHQHAQLPLLGDRPGTPTASTTTATTRAARKATRPSSRTAACRCT